MKTSGSGTEIKLVVPGGVIFQARSRSRPGLRTKMRTLFRTKGDESSLD